MLGTITPLGERSRNRRWGVTTTGYLLGSVVSGAALGAVLGELGALVDAAVSARHTAMLVAFLATLMVAGSALDLGLVGLRLPTVLRQVSQDWPRRYRGFVYGFGFGLQLGAGLTTIVTSSATYLVFLGAAVTGSPVLGAAGGAAFGLVRAATVFTTIAVRTPTKLASMHTALERWYRPVRNASALVQAGVGAAIITGLVS